jgi:hypothetical protein
MATTPNIEQAATVRVEGSQNLRPYRDLLLDCDRPGYEEHLAWVASASEADIIAWAEDLWDGGLADRD